MHNDEKVPGETNCLGWCGKKFYSPDKRRIRFCTKCREKRNNASASLSRMESRLMVQSGAYKDVIPSEVT